ncbi:MAG: hypothetical protein HQL53_07845 [Magnetococcales bacterium]|nr:hypothetical protein [Magnetococcales bacterium]
MSYDASDQTQVQTQNRKIQNREDTKKNDLQHLMAMPEGRRFFRDILQACGVMRLSFAPGGSDRDSAFAEGMRNVGIMLHEQLQEADKELYLHMIKEMMTDE